MRRALVVGNWKMNGSLATIESLLQELLQCLEGYDRADIAVCPPFPYLSQVAQGLENSSLRYGAQNTALEASGAYTGEVSAAMLADLGCTYIIVGHSERRALYGESDDIVAGKCERVLGENLLPILCIGESLKQREAGQTLEVVTGQLEAAIARVGAGAFVDGAVAYEPVWAIGTGKTATPAQAQEVHREIRRTLASHDAEAANRTRILYGGSVKADNAAELFAMADIDGALVGGASLVAQDFATIGKAASN